MSASAGFLICWAPHAVFSIYAAFFNTSTMSPLAASVPSFFAKMSLFVPAILTLVFKNEKELIPTNKTAM